MYRIDFKKRAVRSFNKFDSETQKIIGKKLELLKINPELGKSLTKNLSGLWSLRVGKHRIIYQIKRGELLILVLDMGPRKNIY